MEQIRRHFHDELAQLEERLLEMGERAEVMVGMAVEALVNGDADLADRVIDADDPVDEIYLWVHQRWLEVMALQTPVAVDLRLMSALLHINVTLERMGDQAVNIAKITKATVGLPTNDVIIREIQEMGDVVRPMIRTALTAFVQRDLAAALRLPEMDEPVDHLNRNMYREVVACGGDPRLLEWATRMMMVSRALERVGDQSVDIGEQVAFLLTGEFHELTDTAVATDHGG